MKNLFKPEFSYYGKYYLMLTVLIPFVFIFELFTGGVSQNYIAFFIPFIVINMVSSNMMRENRDQYLSLLPLSAKEIAFVRLSVLIIVPMIFSLMIFLIPLILFRSDITVPVVAVGLILIFYFIIIIQRDLYYIYSKKLKNESAPFSYMIMGLVAAAFMLLGIMLFTEHSGSGNGRPEESFIYIEYVIEFLFSYKGMVVVYLLNIFLSLLSIETFAKRKAYMSFKSSRV